MGLVDEVNERLALAYKRADEGAPLMQELGSGLQHKSPLDHARFEYGIIERLRALEEVVKRIAEDVEKLG